jgi:hypothetical protein
MLQSSMNNNQKFRFSGFGDHMFLFKYVLMIFYNLDKQLRQIDEPENITDNSLTGITKAGQEQDFF